MNFSNPNTLVRIVTSSSLKHSRIKLCIPIDNATPSVEIGAETRIRPTPNTLDFDQYRERIPVMSRHTIPPIGVCERVGKNTPKHKHTDTRHQREVWGQVRATGASRCLFRSLAKSPSVRLSAIPLALLQCWFVGYRATEGRENDGDIVVDKLSMSSLKLSYFENVIFYF